MNLVSSYLEKTERKEKEKINKRSSYTVSPGADIVMYMDGQRVGELQSISAGALSFDGPNRNGNMYMGVDRASLDGEFTASFTVTPQSARLMESLLNDTPSMMSVAVQSMVTAIDSRIIESMENSLRRYDGSMATLIAGDTFFDVESGKTYMFDARAQRFMEVANR